MGRLAGWRGLEALGNRGRRSPLSLERGAEQKLRATVEEARSDEVRKRYSEPSELRLRADSRTQERKSNSVSFSSTACASVTTPPRRRATVRMRRALEEDSIAEISRDRTKNEIAMAAPPFSAIGLGWGGAVYDRCVAGVNAIVFSSRESSYGSSP
jgi:hypothetical protein